MKNQRHEIILALIKQKKIRTHDQLVEELDARGIKVTQATISRDIKDLGIVKISDEEGSFYAVSSDWDDPLQKFSRDIINITNAMNFVVIHTAPGIASAVAAAVDRERKTEIVGTLAGDDTIFIATESPEIAIGLVDSLKKMFQK